MIRICVASATLVLSLLMLPRVLPLVTDAHDVAPVEDLAQRMLALRNVVAQRRHIEASNVDSSSETSI